MTSTEKLRVLTELRQARENLETARHKTRAVIALLAVAGVFLILLAAQWLTQKDEMIHPEPAGSQYCEAPNGKGC